MVNIHDFSNFLLARKEESLSDFIFNLIFPFSSYLSLVPHSASSQLPGRHGSWNFRVQCEAETRPLGVERYKSERGRQGTCLGCWLSSKEDHPAVSFLHCNKLLSMIKMDVSLGEKVWCL